MIPILGQKVSAIPILFYEKIISLPCIFFWLHLENVYFNFSAVVLDYKVFAFENELWFV